MVFAVLCPLLVFTFRLAAAKRAGILEYGVLAQRYVRAFDDKWLRGGAGAEEPLIAAPTSSRWPIGNQFREGEGNESWRRSL